ncbi:lanthionine synthetase LanC family protein [Streptomyces flavovirens]|uniref:lanthionine synthetase LanC family protein n=1 Tax=Streptomyces flavovirens TaxID=52258 RepID=UPI0031F05314
MDVDQPPATEPACRSWCYGQPGTARAQQLAALALGNPARHQAAEDTVKTLLTVPQQLAHTDSALCHGWAGLLTLSRAVAADSPAPRAQQLAGSSTTADGVGVSATFRPEPLQAPAGIPAYKVPSRGK